MWVSKPANSQSHFGMEEKQNINSFQLSYSTLTALRHRHHTSGVGGSKVTALFKLFQFLPPLCVWEGLSTYHDALDNGLHCYISVIARNLIQKHLLGRNLSFQQFPFILRYLCNMGEPLHNSMFLLSTCNKEKGQWTLRILLYHK